MSCLQAIDQHKWDNPIILQILERIHRIQEGHKTIKFCWIPSHIGIGGNERADAAAKAALRLDITPDASIPYTDLRQTINTYFTKTWQEKWSQSNGNKLFAVKPILGDTKFGRNICRRDETILHRLRIGHSHVTHAYLLRHENHPICDFCNCPQSVKHVLIDCRWLALQRIKYFKANSLYNLFHTVKSKRIIDFLKEVQLYNRI